MTNYLALAEKVIKENYEISFKEALSLINTPDENVMDLIYAANKIKQHFRGNEVDLCSIINAKSGNCSEDCSFCAQSAHNTANIETYNFLDKDLIIKRAKEAYQKGAKHFGIVISGKTITPKDFQVIIEIIASIRKDLNPGQTIDGSLGLLTKEQALKLKTAGMGVYSHNLECSKSFFPEMCSTHKYEERIHTIVNAQDAGMKTCVGGIFGLGESLEQRLELAYEIKALHTNGSVPLNFLNQLEGTKTYGQPKLTPFDVLRIIATYRFIMPNKKIRIGGGREVNLRDLQPLMYTAGADGTITGDYLTTTGKNTANDIQMIKDLGLTVAV
jgi:biotin synthase